MAEEARDVFPSPDLDGSEREKQLELLLAKFPWMAHAFLYDEKGIGTMRSRPEQMSDKYIREEHDRLAENFRGWFCLEGKMLVQMLHKKRQRINFSSDHTKRDGEPAYLLTAYFALPQLSNDRVVLGGVTFDPCYLKGTLFPQALDEQINQRLSEQSGNQIAMMIYPAESEMAHDIKPLAATAGWGDAKPAVMRKFAHVFHPLS